MLNLYYGPYPRPSFETLTIKRHFLDAGRRMLSQATTTGPWYPRLKPRNVGLSARQRQFYFDLYTELTDLMLALRLVH